jgi:hypothetical protein
MSTFDMLADQPSFAGTVFTTADIVSGTTAFDTSNAFTGDLMEFTLPDDVWGLNPMSPSLNSWNSKPELAFPGPKLERDLKNSRVRNGQPTPPLDCKDPSSITSDLSGRRSWEEASAGMGMEMRPRKNLLAPQSLGTSHQKRRTSRDQKALASASSGGESDDPPQEQAKREKFLERNRLAASKCRQKKKEHTMLLESRYREQSDRKEEFVAEIARLKSEILGLKNEVLKHAQCGDEPIKLHLAQMVKKITDVDSAGFREQHAEVMGHEASNISPSIRGSISFGFDDPLQLDNPPSAASLEQIRRDSEASLAFSADVSFDDLINV